MRVVQLGLAICALAVLAPAATAQTPAEIAKIERAAASYSVSHFIKGSIAFDPNSNREEGTITPRTPAEAAALGVAFHAKYVGDRSKFYSCNGPTPRACKVSGVDVVVTMNRPEVDANTAFIIVRTYRPTSLARIPVVREERRLRVEKKNGLWVVIGEVGGGSIT